METKPIWASSIVLTQVLLLITLIGWLPEVREVIPMEATGIVNAVLSVATMMLRLGSHAPVSLRGGR